MLLNSLDPRAFQNPILLFVFAAILALVAFAFVFLARKIRRLNQENTALKSAISGQDIWVASMSHELRSPLSALKLHLELLKQSGQVASPQQNHLEGAQIASEQLLSLANDILDGAQIRSGSFALRPSQIDILQTVSTVFETFSALARAKGLQITLHVAPNIPQFMVLDELRLRQVLVNIVSNAIKYTSAGKISISIDASIPNTVTLRVTDTGVGIKEEELNRIFEPFYMIKAEGDGLKGGHSNGLGLAIVKSIAKASGWEVSVRSSTTHTPLRPKGSTFEISIPFTPARSTQGPMDTQTDTRRKTDSLGNESNTHSATIDSASASASASATALASTGVPIQGITTLSVLIVDDLLVNRHVLKLALQKIVESSLLKTNSFKTYSPPLKISTDETGSGQEALNLMSKRPYDLVIVDWNMPGMSGAKLLEKIHDLIYRAPTRAHHRTEIAIISGQIDHSLQLVCHNLKIKHLLTKPVGLKELEELVYETISLDLTP